MYGIFCATGYWFCLTKVAPDSGNYIIKAYCNASMWLESYQHGGTPSRYDNDFCLLRDPQDNSLFWIATSLCAGWSYTGLTSSYNWTSTYINWTDTNAVMVLRSFKITEDDTYKNYEMYENHDFQQNVIYETNLKRCYKVLLV